MGGHYRTRKGKRVLVLRHNGEHFPATFEKLDGRWIYFFDHERVRTKHVRSLGILKGTSDIEEVTTGRRSACGSSTSTGS